MSKYGIIPNFSVFDTKKKEWQQRKNWWKSKGIKSELGRTATGSNTYEDLKNRKNKTKMVQEILRVGGQSIFDPVLCEIIYSWFCLDHSKILDPFAGICSRNNSKLF